jgi:hypothetical protein
MVVVLLMDNNIAFANESTAPVKITIGEADSLFDNKNL